MALYIRALPMAWTFQSILRAAFYISVGLMMWAFLSGLLLLAGAAFFRQRAPYVAVGAQVRAQKKAKNDE